MNIPSCAECPIGGASERCPFVERNRRSGERIYIEGDAADRVWFIKRGAVVLRREGSEHAGEGVAWTVRGPGQLIGAESLVRRTYLDSASTAGPAVLCGAPRDAVDRWLVTASAARTLLELVLLANGSDMPRPTRCDGTALQRVARWLLDESPRRTGVSLPRQTIAELLGMKPETLSRTLAELAERGAITLDRRSLRIADVAALERAAG